VECFLYDFDPCVAQLVFPVAHGKVIRITNLLERLFLEERRRTKIIPNTFGERPVLKLMYAAEDTLEFPTNASLQYRRFGDLQIAEHNHGSCVMVPPFAS